MNRMNVSSTNIVSVGYDAATSTLEIEFSKGNVYQYFGVPESVYNELMSASSKGQFIASQIKGVFQFAKLQ